MTRQSGLCTLRRRVVGSTDCRPTRLMTIDDHAFPVADTGSRLWNTTSQLISRGKMSNFTAVFGKNARLHGNFTEGYLLFFEPPKPFTCTVALIHKVYLRYLKAIDVKNVTNGHLCSITCSAGKVANYKSLMATVQTYRPTGIEPSPLPVIELQKNKCGGPLFPSFPQQHGP